MERQTSAKLKIEKVTKSNFIKSLTEPSTTLSNKLPKAPPTIKPMPIEKNFVLCLMVTLIHARVAKTAIDMTIKTPELSLKNPQAPPGFKAGYMLKKPS